MRKRSLSKKESCMILLTAIEIELIASSKMNELQPSRSTKSNRWTWIRSVVQSSTALAQLLTCKQLWSSRTQRTLPVSLCLSRRENDCNHVKTCHSSKKIKIAKIIYFDVVSVYWSKNDENFDENRKEKLFQHILLSKCRPSVAILSLTNCPLIDISIETENAMKIIRNSLSLSRLILIKTDQKEKIFSIDVSSQIIWQYVLRDQSFKCHRMLMIGRRCLFVWRRKIRFE